MDKLARLRSEGHYPRKRSLLVQAKGSSPKDARLLLITATASRYETQVKVTLPPCAAGGLLLFYSEKAFVGICSDGKNFTLYHDASQTTQLPSRFGRQFFLKIVNRGGDCDLLASPDSDTWTVLLAHVYVSQMHHNHFKGFFALRPGLMAAGRGVVRFENFQYRTLP